MSIRARQLLFWALVASIITGAVALSRVELSDKFADFIGRYGYFGYFLASFVTGINVVFPSAHFVLVGPLLNASLNPLLLGIAAAIGTTCADGVGYLIGASGRAAFPERFHRMRTRAVRVMEYRPALAPFVLFLWAAVVPFPNEALVIPAGILSYGALRTLVITFAGNLCFNILVVYAGHTILL